MRTYSELAVRRAGAEAPSHKRPRRQPEHPQQEQEQEQKRDVDAGAEAASPSARQLIKPGPITLMTGRLSSPSALAASFVEVSVAAPKTGNAKEGRKECAGSLQG